MFRRVLVLSALLIPTFFSALSSAQDAEIVVTATKEPTEAQTLPVPVTVITGDALKIANNLTDALASLTSLHLIRGSGAPYLTAGAFGENGFGRVLLLLDGFSQSNPDQAAPPLNLVPLFAIDRVEILNGPGSALYGNSAVGGVVQVVTKTPKKFEVHLTSSVTQNLSNSQDVALSVPIGPAGLLASVEREQTVPGRDRTSSNTWNIWSKLAVPFGDAQGLTLWGSFHTDESQLPGSLTKTEFGSNPDQADKQQDLTTLSESQGGIEWKLDSSLWSFAIPASALYRKSVPNFGSPPFPYYLMTQLTSYESEPRLKVILENAFGGSLTLVTGIGGKVQLLLADRFPDSTYSSPLVETLVQRKVGQVWVAATENWADTLFFSTALRQEIALTSAVSVQEPYLDKEKDFYPFSGAIGLTFLPAPSAKLGIQLSRVFRYPFIDEMISYLGYGSDYFLTDLDPEIGHGINVTGGFDLTIAKLQLNVSVLRMENEVFSDPVTFVNFNGGPTFHTTGGFDLEVPFQATKEVTASAAGVVGHFERAWFLGNGYPGNVVPLVPLQTWDFWYKARIFNCVTMKTSWTWTSSYFAGGDYANSQTEIPPRQSINIDLLWDLISAEKVSSMALTIKAWGHNLTNDRTPSFAYSTGWYPSDARTFGIGATVDY